MLQGGHVAVDDPMSATDDLTPAPANAMTGLLTPLVKWAGGKRKLAPQIVPRIDLHLRRTGGTYIEPFLGGGAIALALNMHSSMLLGDVNETLITTYQAVVCAPDAVADALRDLVAIGMDRVAFEAVRASAPGSSIAVAARMLYLNRLCFNGLWRVNSKGQFNVPFGKYKNPSLPTRAHLCLFSSAMRHATFLYADFRHLIAQAQRGDAVYADPPYHTTFDRYAVGAFTEADHLDLAMQLRAAADRGVLVCASNANTDFVRDLYGWADVQLVEEARAINSNAEGRGNVSTVLIWSRECR
jgi:DNA adenine methylase